MALGANNNFVSTCFILAFQGLYGGARTYIEVNTIEFFLPQSRPRLYIMGVRADIVAGIPARLVTQFLSGFVQRMSSNNDADRLTMSDVLLPETHPAIMRWNANCTDKEAPDETLQPSKRLKWADQHMQRVGVDAWLDMRVHYEPEMLDMFPGLKSLTVRQRDSASAGNTFIFCLAGGVRPRDPPVIVSLWRSRLMTICKISIGIYFHQLGMPEADYSWDLEAEPPARRKTRVLQNICLCRLSDMT